MPGQPSAGSTSPLWTVLLAAGYRLGLEYHVWTSGLGYLLLVLLAWLSYRLTLTVFPDVPAAAWGAGLAVALEWHLLWAAGSGMEILLLAVFALTVLPGVVKGVRFPGLPGVLIGLSVGVRPDGLILLPVAALGMALQSWKQYAGLRHAQFRAAGLRVGALLVGFALIFVPYLLFNRTLGGEFWPNTFYAKQAEYAAQLAVPFPVRFLDMWIPLLAGGLVLLLPGLLLMPPIAYRVSRIAYLVSRIANYQLPITNYQSPISNPQSPIPNPQSPTLLPSSFFLLPLLWALGHVTLYALRLPVTYQHGRYLIPIIPVLVVYGVGGMAAWLRLNDRRTWRRIASRVWLLGAVGLWAAFVAVGARAYARDVAIIETEMVATARWLATHTAPDDLIAAHDIGAIGYFAGRPLLDMAGLVSPEVIPFIRDQARLAAWLDAQRADYLVTFPGWYPELISRGAPVVFSTEGLFSPAAGGENMQVVHWRFAPSVPGMLYSRNKPEP